MRLLIPAVLIAALAPQARAESRSVLILVTQPRDQPLVTIHSDDKEDRRDQVTVDEACKAVAGIKGWGSVVSVSVVTDRAMPRKARRTLFDAIDANGWLDLVYYGTEIPKHLADYFLKPVGRVPPPRPDDEDTAEAFEKAAKRGAATAAADIKAGRPVILYYGEPRAADKPPVDEDTGLPVEVAAGCRVSRRFVAEVDAYNAAVRAWHKANKPGK